jgi:hypothetical protein
MSAPVRYDAARVVFFDDAGRSFHAPMEICA